ncbi:MAG TPA: hypothetical protein VII11_08305, partial [Bacteroidota bacterium]
SVLIFRGPCDESLPPYSEPEMFLTGSISGQYILTATDNSMKVYFSIKNIFDETLQGQAVMRGTMEIVSMRNPNVHKTYALSISNVSNPGRYDPATGILTFDPGDSVVYLASWNFIADDQGADLRTSYFRYVSDPVCTGRALDGTPLERCHALTEEFILRSEIIVFEGRAPVRATVLFPLCYVSRWVNPKYCPPIITSPPCGEPAPQYTPACNPSSFIPILGKLSDSANKRPE